MSDSDFSSDDEALIPLGAVEQKASTKQKKTTKTEKKTTKAEKKTTKKQPDKQTKGTKRKGNQSSKPNKKGKKHASSDDDDDDDDNDKDGKDSDNDDDDDDDDDDDGIMNVEFAFYDPREDTDFHAIKRLCRNYIDVNKGEFDTSGLADLIVNQRSLGTTVKTDGNDNQPIAFATALSLHTHKDQQCMKQIKHFLLQKCPPKHKQAVQTLLEDTKKPLGLLIHNRLVNLPIQLVPPLHDALRQDIEWAVDNEEPEERAALDFQNFIIIGRAYTSDKAFVPINPGEEEIKEEARGKKKKKKSSGGFGGKMPSHGFFKFFEEETYHAASKITYHTAAKTDFALSETEKIPQNHVIMIVPRKELPGIHQRIKQFLGLA